MCVIDHEFEEDSKKRDEQKKKRQTHQISRVGMTPSWRRMDCLVSFEKGRSLLGSP